MPISEVTIHTEPPPDYVALPLAKPFSKAAGPITKGKVLDMYTKAVDRLRAVVQKLNDNTLTETDLGHATAFFAGASDLSSVKAQLELTLDGLVNNQITVHVGGAMPYVKRLTWPDWINFPMNVLNHPVQSIRYFIHEATHLYADAKDTGLGGKKGYINNDGNFREAGITAEEALVNADSLACFVTRVFGDNLV